MRNVSKILPKTSNSPPFLEIGARLKQARLALGFSNQERFGRAVGYAGRSISAMETGTAEPGFRVLHYLAQRGVDLGHLLTGVVTHAGSMAQHEISSDKSAEYFLMRRDDLLFFEQYCRSPEKIKMLIKLFIEPLSRNSDKKP